MITIDSYSSRRVARTGIYPAALQLNNTTVRKDKEVTFLGMRIRNECNKFFLSPFDKRREFPFRVLRYPHTNSVIPINIPYGVLLGQLHRFFRICSSRPNFVAEARTLVSVLQRQGCSRWKLRKYTLSFLQSKLVQNKRSHMRLHIPSVLTQIFTEVDPG